MADPKSWEEMSKPDQEVVIAKASRQTARELEATKVAILARIKEAADGNKIASAGAWAEAYALVSGTLSSYKPTAG